MTEKDREIQELRRSGQQIREDYERLVQSETVRWYLKKGVDGSYLRDIGALDRGIRELHTRCVKAERDAQTYLAEATYYRRKFEALEMERKEEEEHQFPLFNAESRGNENQHPEAQLSCCRL